MQRPLLIAAACCVAACALAASPKRSAQDEQLRQQAMEAMGMGAPDETESPDAIRMIVQTGHAGALTAVARSPDGRWVLSGGMDESVKLWDTASGGEVRNFPGQVLLWPTAVAFSRQGSRIVVGDSQTTRIYDAATGQQLLSVSPSNWPLLVAAGGGVIVGETTLRGRGEMLVIDTATGAVTWTVPTTDLARALALSRDGRMLATLTRAGGGSQLEIWDLEHHSRLSRTEALLSLGSFGLSSALSSDGRTLAVENVQRDVELIDTAAGKSIRTLTTDARVDSGLTTQIAFSPDGLSLLWATSSDVARQWTLANGQRATLAASAMAWSDDGKMLVIGHGSGGAPMVREVESGKETPFEAGAAEVADLAVLPGGRALIAAMHDGTAKWWDLTTGEIVRSFHCPGSGAASSVAVSRAHALVALGCWDGSATIWDAASAELRQTVLAPAAGQLEPVLVRFAVDDSTVVVAHQDEVVVWDAGAARELRRFKLPAQPPAAATLTGASPPAYQQQDWITALAAAPQGQWIAIGRAREVGLWDVRSGQMVRRFVGASPFASMMPQGLPGSMPPARGRGGLGISAGGGMAGLAMSGMPGLAGAGNPFAALDSMFAQSGAHSAAFSADGKVLATEGRTGQQFWDVGSGRELTGNAAATRDPNQLMSAMMGVVGSALARGVALSGDGHTAAVSFGRLIKVMDVASRRVLAQLKGHASEVTALAFVDEHTLVSGGRDGTIRVWRLPEGRQLAALTALGRQDFVALTPDGYYRASKSRLQGVSFRVGGKLYPFEQFDLRFNRPDLVLERLGTAPAELVQAYRHAYQRRLQKMGFTEAMLGRDFHLPVIELRADSVPVSSQQTTLTLAVKASDDQYGLDRFLAFVNDVPVFGTAGRAISGHPHMAQAELVVPLIAGRNKIQVSVLNQQGVESLRETVFTNAPARPEPPDVWVIAIGVSHYQNSRYDLRFAAKDAGDIVALFQAPSSAHGTTHVLSITDGQATREGIRAARAWLADARPQDLAVVFVAGHGMVDPEQNYFFGTFDIDPSHPAVHGLPFEEFENLLDGVPPLQKLLLVDTCFSGEIERDDVAVASPDAASDGNKVTMRAFQNMRGIKVAADITSPTSTAAAPLPNYSRFQRDWFADLRRGTGAATISSSSGNEYSLEGEKWHNGVFTYAVLDGLKNGRADRNGDGVVSVSELEAYVIGTVGNLTQGAQNPTVRRENLDFDFRVY